MDRQFKKIYTSHGGGLIMKLLIKNGRVIHPVTGTILLQDLLLENGDRKSVV